MGVETAADLALEFGELSLEVIEEERVDEAPDVVLGGVVGALGAALLRLHHALEERAEDAGRNARPVELTASQERGAVLRRHVRDVEALGEEAAVDVAKGGELGIERRGAGGEILVEHLEEAREAGAEIGAVLARAG